MEWSDCLAGQLSRAALDEYLLPEKENRIITFKSGETKTTINYVLVNNKYMK